MKYTMKSKLQWFKSNRNKLIQKILVLAEIVGSPSGMLIFEHKKNKKCDICINKETRKCPRASLCFNKISKPYFKNKEE